MEAVVSVKTAIEAIDGDEEKNRRTTHIPSMPLLVRARAPVLDQYIGLFLYWGGQCIGLVTGK